MGETPLQNLQTQKIRRATLLLTDKMAELMLNLTQVTPQVWPKFWRRFGTSEKTQNNN